MKPSLKIALGIFTSLFTIGFIFFYDFYLKERIDSVEVVVVKTGQEIARAEQLTQADLVIERRPKKSLIEDVVLAEEFEKVIGKDSSQTILGNSMLSHKMIDYDGIVPDSSKGEAIRPITNEMIFAQPGSLRRKDVIDIYLVNEDGKTVSIPQQERVTEEGDSETETDSETSSEEESTSATATIQSEAFLKGVPVVYVKDSGNKEVVSSEEENSKDKRLNATSNISDIEVIMNEVDFNKLMNEVLRNGSKLYITYQ